MSRTDGAPERTHYDVLGVDRSADAGTISKAWRRRTRRAGPGSPEFARINEAAETLLNPDRRAAYDATLPEPVAPAAAGVVDESAAAARPRAAAASSRSSGRIGWIVAIAILTALAVASVVLAVVYHGRKSDTDAITRARTEAAAAARTGVGVVLSYSWNTMPANLKDDLTYLTPAYAKVFTQNFNLLTASKDGVPSPVAQTKTIVTAAVTGTAVMDAGANRANVLVFADQTAVHKAGAKQQECPCVLHDRVKVSMVRQHGDWLIDDLQTS